MKRLLVTSVITLALFAGAPSEAPRAYANANDTVTGSIGTQPAIDAAAAEAAAKSAADLKETPDDSYNFVMQKILTLFAWLVGVAALTLEYAVFYTVFSMGAFVKNISAIGLTWQILRDIGNIMLIFGFLAVGISIILNTERLGYGKKMLPMLLVAAVFMNFSLFFAEAIIDTGNLFAAQFYTQINGGVAPTATTFNTADEGISNKLMSQLGLQVIYGKAKDPDAAKTLLKGANPWLIGFMGILLFIVTAFVLFSLAFILIARFVILIFLIILAPVGFAGLAIPQLASTAKKWWNSLFQQTLTAPVLLLMLYVALRVITDDRFLSGFGAGQNADWFGTINNNLNGFGAIFLTFLVAMGLLIFVTILAKNLSAFGAGAAMKGAGALSFGATAWAGRGTLGGVGNLLASKRMQSWARRSGTGGLALKGAVLAGKGLRGRTYDVRNLPLAGGLSALGIDAGKASPLTAKQVHDAQYGAKPVKEWFKHSKEEREAAGHEMDFKDAQSDLAAGKITQAQYDAIVAPVLARMSTKELEELGGIKKGTDALVKNLSPQQFEALMKSDKLDDAAKGKIKEARYRPIEFAVASGSVPAIKTAINGLSKGELESLPSAMLARPQVLSALSDKQRDTIYDSKERTSAEKDLVRNSSPVGSVEAAFNAVGGGPAGAAAALAHPNFARLTPTQIAKLDKPILVERTIAQQLRTPDLVELQEQKKLTSVEMQSIGNHIRGNPAADAKTMNYITAGPGAAFW